ncbi:MAG: PilZ domain-containing protein [Deltaproteobacteria bacterium]|nr:PilZ domain-containing protein [Deltaproteobacteria bacterium]
MADRRKIQRRIQKSLNIEKERRRIERRKGERRESPRVAVKMWLDGLETEDKGWEYFGNISLGGAFIETDTPPEEGKYVNIKLREIDEEGDLILRGEVIGVDIEKGIRVRFTDTTFEDERRLARYIDELIRKGLIY